MCWGILNSLLAFSDLQQNHNNNILTATLHPNLLRCDSSKSATTPAPRPTPCTYVTAWILMISTVFLFILIYLFCSILMLKLSSNLGCFDQYLVISSKKWWIMLPCIPIHCTTIIFAKNSIYLHLNNKTTIESSKGTPIAFWKKSSNNIIN